MSGRQAYDWSGLKFIQGEPVDPKSTKDNIVVLELWATWCGPCRSTIPHLNSLQEQYAKKGVIFVGITDETDENKIKKFIQSMGNNMKYRVAIDSNGVMDDFQREYSVRGIPHAFIINNNNQVIYSGHPASPEFQSKLDVAANQLLLSKKNQDNTNKKNKLKELSTAELNEKSPKELLSLMKEAGISDAGCVEKADLIARIQGKQLE